MRFHRNAKLGLAAFYGDLKRRNVLPAGRSTWVLAARQNRSWRSGFAWGVHARTCTRGGACDPSELSG